LRNTIICQDRLRTKRNEKQTAERRIHVGHALVFIYLEDIDPGEGGLLVVPGSHKSNFDRVDSLAVHGPYGGRQEDRGSVVLRDAPGATECPVRY
jgi:hypothetical protein